MGHSGPSSTGVASYLPQRYWIVLQRQGHGDGARRGFIPGRQLRHLLLALRRISSIGAAMVCTTAQSHTPLLIEFVYSVDLYGQGMITPVCCLDYNPGGADGCTPSPVQ